MKKFIIKDPVGVLVVQEECDVEVSVPSHSDLDHILESFTLFLKASGYVIDGQYLQLLYYDDLK